MGIEIPEQHRWLAGEKRVALVDGAVDAANVSIRAVVVCPDSPEQERFRARDLEREDVPWQTDRRDVDRPDLPGAPSQHREPFPGIGPNPADLGVPRNLRRF